MKSFRFTTLLVVLCLATAKQSAEAQELFAHYPSAGGPVTLGITADPVRTSGIEFVPVFGKITKGESAAPFSFFLHNRAAPGNVMLGTLGTPVTIDGPVELDVWAAPGTNATGSWGRGTTVVNMPVFNSSHATAILSYPYDGGPLTLQPRFTRDTIKSLSVVASRGSLAGGNAAPFDTLTENTSEKWEANSEVPLTINGPVILDLVASADASIYASGKDEWNEFLGVQIFRNDPKLTTALVGSFDRDGGPITIESTSGPFATRSLDLSFFHHGRLVVYADSSPAPFTSLDENSEDHWKVSSDVNVVIDGRLTLDAFIPANQFADLHIKALTFDGTTTQRFEVYGVPEPSTQFTLWLGLLGLMAFRRRAHLL